MTVATLTPLSEVRKGFQFQVPSFGYFCEYILGIKEFDGADALEQYVTKCTSCNVPAVRPQILAAALAKYIECFIREIYIELAVRDIFNDHEVVNWLFDRTEAKCDRRKILRISVDGSCVQLEFLL